jgi:hypothetical protein
MSGYDIFGNVKPGYVRLGQNKAVYDMKVQDMTG